jgi:arabinose-5-phosphate isomerase
MKPFFTTAPAHPNASHVPAKSLSKIIELSLPSRNLKNGSIVKSKYDILATARQTLAEEAAAIKNLEEYLDDDFAAVVELILHCKGRLVVTGIGKSAIIGNKIVATLNSTGTPALFMHAADAIHGDLGMITPHDVVLCISKSGNTPEIKILVPLIKRYNNTLVAMVSDTSSYLAEQSDLVLKATVAREACPNNLAPTSSTTAQLALGDALAVCLLDCRGFSQEDFAKYHPGGALGKKMYMTVGDLLSRSNPPMVAPRTPLKDTILEISRKRLGATAVVSGNKNLLGIITDGDLRRMLEKTMDFSSLTAQNIMTKTPRTIEASSLAIKAFNMMEDFKITQLAVLENDIFVGIIHMHDILREGIV